ncbi:radical SAM protein [Paenibacillus maysiensis]|uniref:radical SAM protein n=1 Tax=Paenibacillus maysiensis TaxID=1155954 RepID=UPI00046EAE12|nr:radical SAM/SPASM domain-containing protein [Paenibacillus maysiensis]
MYIKWNLTKKCTLGCKFCINAEMRKEWNTDIDEDGLQEMLERIAKINNLKGITLLGGDPLDYKYIFELANGLEQQNIPFGFITAGEHLYTGKYDLLLKNKKLEFIGLSIDSLDRGIVESIRGRDILKAQLESLDYLLKVKENNNLNYKIFTNSILMNINKESLIDLIDFFIRRNVDKIQILEYNHRAKSKNDFSLPFTEELLFVEKLIAYLINMKENTEAISKLELCFVPELGKEYIEKNIKMGQLSKGNSNVCPVFRETAFISNDGFIYPCDSYKPYLKFDEETEIPEKIYKIENMLQIDFNDVVEKNEFFSDLNELIMKPKEELYGNFEPCQECKYLLKSCYPCLVVAENYKDETIAFGKCLKYKELLTTEKAR